MLLRHKKRWKKQTKRNTDLLPDTFVLIKLVISSSYQIRNVTVKNMYKSPVCQINYVY